MLMGSSFEMKIEDIDFEYLYKIIKINLKKVTFKKCSIKRLGSEKGDDVDIVFLDKVIGEETYEVTPEVSAELVGHVGDIIKGYEADLVGSKRKKLVVNKIIHVFGDLE